MIVGMNEAITTAQAAKLLDVSTETVRQWAISGKLKPVMQAAGSNGMRLFDRADVERLATERSAA